MIDRLIGILFKRNEFLQRLRAEVQRIIYHEPMIIGPADRLHIQEKALCNNFLANTNSGDIWIEDYVFFGKNVCLITGTHDYTKFDRERVESYPRSGQNIILRRGAWIATNATIIGPCEVGVGAVVAAGSVVTENVPPYVVVAGVPARVVKVLQP